MSVTCRSFAKINLHLQVVGRRADGYHELRTVFQSVDLADLVVVEEAAAGVALTVAEGEAPAGPTNLAARAATAFLARWAPGRGVRLTLHKRIPPGGGLGGGSSNAAAVLQALPGLLGVEVEFPALWELARDLGADVPYFLVGGTALGVGRGDEVVPLPDLPEQEVWLILPPLAISTAEVFGALGAPRSDHLDPGIAAMIAGGGPLDLASLPARNDLEETARALYPLLGEVYNALHQPEVTCARLSGSGATVFACLADSSAGERVAARLPAGTRVVRSRTLGRSALRARRSLRDGIGG